MQSIVRSRECVAAFAWHPIVWILLGLTCPGVFGSPVESQPMAEPVRVGLPLQAPLVLDTPEPSGFLVELWQRMAAAEGLELELHIGDDEEVLSWLRSGDVDLHGGLQLGAGGQDLALGPPMATICHGLFGSGAPLAFDRWRGHRVAVTPSLRRAELFNPFDVEIVPAENAAAAVRALGGAQVDLVVGPSQETSLALQEAGLAVEQRALHCPWVVPAAVESREPILRRLQRGFESLDMSELRELEDAWRAPSAPSLLAPGFDVSETELAWLAEHAAVHLGASVWVPMTEQKEDGVWSGLGLEIVRAIFQKLGLLVTFGGDDDWLKVVADTEAGVYDGLGYTRADDEKRRYLNFTSPVVSPLYIIANRIDAPFLRGLEALDGARLAVIQHYAIYSWLEENHPQIELVPVYNAVEGLQRLSDGEVEAYLDILPAVTQMTNRLGFKNIKLATRLQVSSNMAIGIRRDWAPLVDLLERSIEVTGEAERQRIYEAWDTVRLERQPSRLEVWRAAAWIASPLLLLLAVLGVRLVQQRRRARESKQRLRRQVSHLQKLEALGTLGKGVSHEFNNILQAILGYADLAAESSDESERRRSLERIVHSAHRAQDIVGQILSFSHRQPVERRPVDLATMLEEAGRLLRASLPAQVDIALDIDQHPCFVLGEPEQIKQILMNLASNSADAMPDGGRLEIRLDGVDEDDGIEVTTGTLDAGRFWRLYVCDEGVGIAPELQTRIFDPFFSTHELGEGSGLGLSVVHGIVTAYGGGIRVSSAPGQGACFEIFLPQARPAAVPEEAPRSGPPSANGRRRRILIVDDETYLTDIVERCLGREYNTRVFNDGSDAYEAFADDPASFDLVLSDLNMPGITGEQLAEKVKELRPDLPIVIMTGYSSRVLSERLASGTIRRVLEKPVRPAELLDAVSQELGV